MSDKILPKIEHIKLPMDELMVLAEMADTTYFEVIKRLARRYAESMKNYVFSLDPADPKLPIKHATYKEQAVGMQLLITAIADARKKLESKEE
jgi:hypothetical protein